MSMSPLWVPALPLCKGPPSSSSKSPTNPHGQPAPGETTRHVTRRWLGDVPCGASQCPLPAATPCSGILLEEHTMNDLDFHIGQLVIANRILANEGVVDAYGHVSIRHPHTPECYLLSWSRSPELVECTDIMEFTLDGKPVSDGRAPYLERFIHGAIYEARPDIHAVVHAHAEDVLTFSRTTTPRRPVIHSGSFMGAHVPVWDIADNFGDQTNLLVTNMAQGRDLARCLGSNSVALMRGHGFAAAASSLI